jgi:protein-S-isoprenylcysteine O-methyltransferase Ste14
MTFLVIEPIGILSLILMISGAALCLVSYLLRLAAHILTYWRASSPIDVRLILAVTFLGYFGWGYWSGADPVKMNIPARVAVPAGASLAAAGMGLFLYSELKRHGVGDTDRLISTGIYSKIRHPMYIGLVLLHFGFPLVARSFTACLSTILWTGIIAAWTWFEEKNLERRFGERYRRYKRQTWF